MENYVGGTFIPIEQKLAGAAQARLKQADDALYPKVTDSDPMVELALVQATALTSIATSLAKITGQLDRIADGVSK